MDDNETKDLKFHSQPNYYAIIPADVRYSDLPSSAKLLYGEITALCNKEGYCWATNSYFAELYKVNLTTVSEWVKLLKDRGFVTYEIIDNKRRKIWPTLREKPKVPSGKAEGEPSGKAEHNNTSVNNKTNTSSPQSGGVAFEAFWQLYPKKVEKKKTEAKWNRLKKSTQDTILADLPKRKQTDQWQRGYVPNPMTYLNGERWNDEIAAAPATTSNTTGRNFTQERIEDEREREREREQARQNRMVEQRADPNSPAVQKFRAMKEKFKIGH